MRRLLVAVALGCVVVALSACGSGAPSRSELAESAAVGVVAAMARGDSVEIDHRLGSSGFDADSISPSLPESFGADPKMYSATMTGSDPERSDEVEAIVAMDMVNPGDPTRVRVMMVWVPGKDSTGGWDVTSVSVLGP